MCMNSMKSRQIAAEFFDDLINHCNRFFRRIIAGRIHVLQIITKNIDETRFFNIQDKDLSAVVSENHTAHGSADTKMQILRQVVEWWLKHAIITGSTTVPDSVKNFNALYRGQWMIEYFRNLSSDPCPGKLHQSFHCKIDTELMILNFIHIHLKSMFR